MLGRAWTLCFFLAGGLVLCLAPLPVEASPFGGWNAVRPAAEEAASYRVLRYRGVVGQTSWSTCGPAVLATYFTYYAGRETTEAEMIRLILEEADKAGADSPAVRLEVSLLDLKDALQWMGVDAAGFRVGLDELAAYFERGGPPLILHVTAPRLHYLLAIGLVPGKPRLLLAADPSFGQRVIGLHELVRDFGFLGYVLVPVPPDPMLRQVKARQAEELVKAGDRLRRLEAAGRWGL